MKIKRLNYDAIIPKKAHKLDAGFDLFSLNDSTLFPGNKQLFRIGWAFQCPTGYYIRIAPRSGLAFKYGIDVLAGVVDENYRDEVGIILVNHGKKAFKIKKGDRIAQAIVTKIDQSELEIVDELDSSDRELNGFGSTGR